MNKNKNFFSEQLNSCGKGPSYIDDSLLRGGFRVVKTIKERDEIDCCHRKWGMKVLVIGPELDFKEYVLKSRKCRDNVWEEVQAGGSSSDDTKANVDASNVVGNNVLLWRNALDIYNKSEVNNKFLNGTSETAQIQSDWDAVGTVAEILNKPIIPTIVPQVKSDWNAVSGPEEILNKPTIPTVVPQEQADWEATSGVSFIKNKPTIPPPVDISGKMDKIAPPDNTNLKVVLGDNTVRPLETFELGDQIEVELPATVQASWIGKVVLFTNSGTLTIPTGLPDSWSFNGATLGGVTLSLSITSPKTWLFGTPISILEKQIFTIAQRGSTNSIMLFGI